MPLRNLTVLCVALVALFVAGCERAAQVDSPNHLVTDGVTFDYPGNWDVKKNELQPTGRSIVIQSPGAAIAIVRIFPVHQQVDLKAYAHQIGETMEKDFAKSRLLIPGQAMTYTEAGKPSERSVSIHYSVKLAGVDVPHTMVVREKTIGAVQIVTTMQVADKHAFQAEPGFDLITSTLKPYR